MKKLLFAALALISVSAFPQSDKETLDRYFDALEQNNKFMGTVMLRKDGKEIYSKSIGFADVASKQPIKKDTRFRVGSVSKMFTAAMIMKAAEENKLSLEDKLSKYYPTIPNADRITLEQMLAHRSGIHNFTSDELYYSYYSLPRTEAQMVDVISKTPSDFEPDSKASYSNSNYYLLSLILQKAYKKPFADILNDKILKPLKLKNTTAGNKINTANNEANSYSYEGVWKIETETDPSVPLGAGAIVSNAADLTTFIENLFAGKIVTPASLAKMQTLQDGYGLGMFTFPFYDETGYAHTGGIDGFSSVLAYFPKNKLSFVQLSNGANYDTNKVTIATLSHAFGKPIEVPEFKNITYTADELQQFTGVYSSAQFPLKITISVENNTLMAQATGQSAFPLDPVDTDIFTFDPAGIKIRFDRANSEISLLQGGMQFTFKKE